MTLKETRDEFNESINIEYHLYGRLRHFSPQIRSNGYHPRQTPLPVLVSSALLTYLLTSKLAVLSALLLPVRVILVLLPDGLEIDWAATERIIHILNSRYIPL